MSESVLLRIDNPADLVLRTPVCRIRGWCAWTGSAAIGRFELRIGDARVPWQPQTRPDVTAGHPDMRATGFIIDFDLSQYLYAIRSNELSLVAAVSATRETELQFSVAPGVLANCLAAAAGV